MCSRVFRVLENVSARSKKAIFDTMFVFFLGGGGCFFFGGV